MATGNGKLDVTTSSHNNKPVIELVSPGNYKLSVSSKKAIFDEEDNLIFTVDGNPLNGSFQIYRPYPDLKIGIEQKAANAVTFKITYPDWISNPNFKLRLPTSKTSPIEFDNLPINSESNNKVLTTDIEHSKFQWKGIVF